MPDATQASQDWQAATGTPIKLTKSLPAKASAKAKVPTPMIILNIFNLLTYEISDILENALNLIENSSTLQKNVLNHDFLYGENEVISKYLNFIKQEGI